MNESIFQRVDKYISNLFSLEDEVLQETLLSMQKEKMPKHSVSANQGQFLCQMAKLCNAKKIVEIGTLGGYSTIWLGRALPEHGKLISIEIDPKFAEIARQNIKRAQLEKKIEIKVGSAIEILPELANEAMPVDLFFIDADKTNYINYFKWALKMCRKASLIIADNVIREGKILDRDSQDEKVVGVQNYLKFLSENKEVEMSVLQQIGEKEHDGIAISRVL